MATASPSAPSRSAKVVMLLFLRSWHQKCSSTSSGEAAGDGCGPELGVRCCLQWPASEGPKPEPRSFPDPAVSVQFARSRVVPFFLIKATIRPNAKVLGVRTTTVSAGYSVIYQRPTDNVYPAFISPIRGLNEKNRRRRGRPLGRPADHDRVRNASGARHTTRLWNVFRVWDPGD